MKLNSYVVVINEGSELYRRRCQIVDIKDNLYTVYSEGLEQHETLTEADIKPSKW